MQREVISLTITTLYPEVLENFKQDLAKLLDQHNATGKIIAVPFKPVTAGHASISTHFTLREKQVFAQLRKARSSKEIARIFGISDGTVKIHATSLYRKLGITNRREVFLVSDETLKQLEFDTEDELAAPAG